MARADARVSPLIRNTPLPAGRGCAQARPRIHSLTAPGAPRRPRSGLGGRRGAQRGGVAAGLVSTVCARRPERAAAGKARAPVPGDRRPEAGPPGDEGRPPTPL